MSAAPPPPPPPPPEFAAELPPINPSTGVKPPAFPAAPDVLALNAPPPPAKKPAAKPAAKPAVKTIAKKQTIELEDELEEDVVVQTKNTKTHPKAGSKTQIHLSDDEEEAN